MLPDPSEWMSTDRPLPAEEKWGIPILTPKAKEVVRGVMMTADVVGHLTHYWFGRTRPCLKVECEPCLKFQPRSWHGYFPIFNPQSKTIAMLQVPSSAAKHFDAHLAAHHSCERWQIEIRRVGEFEYGRVHVRFVGKACPTLELPDYPNVHEYLHRLWSQSSRHPTPERERQSKPR